MVVVAGGDYTEHEFNFLSSVELLFLNDFEPSWFMGPSLPKAVGFGTMVEFQNTVIFVGGKGDADGRNLYQLSSPDGTWTEMKQTLRYPRIAHTSFLVPDDLVNCH